jgi:hypothetical protein
MSNNKSSGIVNLGNYVVCVVKSINSKEKGIYPDLGTEGNEFFIEELKIHTNSLSQAILSGARKAEQNEVFRLRPISIAQIMLIGYGVSI